MVVTCDIEFDNNSNGIYFAGQMLTGRVTLKSDKPKNVKGVALKINGLAYTRWRESHSGRNARTRHSSRARTYTGQEDYIASITYLLGSDAGQQVKIEPGIHTYNFACHIPESCPSSFECTWGHVRYSVTVVLIRPWKFDQTYSKCFTVLKNMNLNYDSPLLRMPANVEVEKTYFCWPCQSDPLKMQLSLPQTGYVPGQIIPIGVLVTNESSMPVEALKVTLAMLISYYSQFPAAKSRHERIVVAKLKGERVLRQCKKNFVYQLRVPATPPTCFNLCRIIQIAYQIEVEAEVKGCHANQMLSIPVTIGSVPLISSVQQQPRNYSTELTTTVQPKSLTALSVQALETTAAEVVTTAPIIAVNNSSSPWAEDYNIPPPNYEEAVHIQQIAHKNGEFLAEPEEKTNSVDYGQTDYVPLYPVFDVPSPTAPDVNSVFSNADNMNAGVSAATADKGTWL